MNEKTKMSKTKLSVLIVCALFVVSMLGTFIVQTNGFSVKVYNKTCTLEELVEEINANNEKYGKDLGDTLSKAADGQISIAIYQPANATESNKAPAIVCAHGWNNSKEMQYHNIVELAKRGFVVVSVDLAGHGRTDEALLDESGWGNGNTEGTLAAIEYAMSLGFVDENSISVVGHSAGDLALTYSIQQINKADSKKHIDAFYCPGGTMAAFLLTRSADAIDNLVLGVACGKYDELDTAYFGTYDLSTSYFAKFIFSAFYPGVMSMETIPLGEYYNADGAIATPAAGQKLGVSKAIIMRNPEITHPGAVMDTGTTADTIDFFYAVYGTPSGATYIESSSQTWVIGVVFQCMGLLTFFAAIVVFGFALLKTKRYADLNREVPAQENLPSIKNWREIVLIVVTFVPILLFAFFMYFPCFDDAANVISSNNMNTNVDGIAWYTLANGLFLLVMICVNYGLRKLLYKGTGVEVKGLLENVCKVDSVGHFFKSVSFAVVLLLLIFLPVCIAYFCFDIDFGIAVYVVGVPRLQWLPEILLKYLPMWFVYLIGNAALNANTRYKEIPEWASTAFCVLANVAPIVISIIINYSTLYSTGATKWTFGDPTIFAWNLIAPMILIGITNRMLYKKTGNIWIPALVNASVLTIMACTITRHISDVAFFF